MECNFIIAINQWLKWMCHCAPPGVISPIPVQGYADDVLMVSREECEVKNTLARTDAFLKWSGLEIKDKNLLFCTRGGVEGTGGTVQNLINVQCLK